METDRHALGDADLSHCKPLLPDPVFQSLRSRLEDLSKHIAEQERCHSQGGSEAAATTLLEVKGNLEQFLRRFSEAEGDDLQSVEGGEVTIAFNKQGPWDPEHFHLLGASLEPFADLALVLDKSRFRGVVEAVEALNAGILNVAGSYCIGWSAHLRQYYMLFQRHAEKDVGDLLAKRRFELASEIRRSKRSLFRAAVEEIIASSDIQDLVARNKAERDRRVATRLKVDLESEFAAKANAEMESVMAQARAEATAKESEAERESCKIKQEATVAAEAFEKQVAALNMDLEFSRERIGFQRGAHLVSLKSELEHSKQLCRSLTKSMQDVMQLTAQECEHVDEALAFMVAMVNNPDTLPGFSEFVDALRRCQEIHTSSEELCCKAGFDGPLSALEEARRLMICVSGNVRHFCENAANDTSLVPGLESLRGKLIPCRKVIYLMMRLGTSLLARLDRADNLIQAGLRHLDVETAFSEKRSDVSAPRVRNRWHLLMKQLLGRAGCEDGSKDEKAKVYLMPSLALTPAMGARAAFAETLNSPVTSPRSRRGLIRRRPPAFFRIGDVVEDRSTRRLRGRVRYTGSTEFAPGDWVGVELDRPVGKNDGSVHGTNYFSCQPGHGLFFRSAALYWVSAPLA